jgi:superfamily I DNA and RNA helicase
MAIIIPQSLPSQASQGEQRFFRICAEKLPNHYYIWYEPRINSKHPDFIILAPDFGLLIIEIKGWYSNNIIEGNQDYFCLKTYGEDYHTTEQQKSPLSQARDYLNLMLNQLREYPILTQKEGNYQGQLAFPIGWGAIMSNITNEQAKKIDLTRILPKPQVAYRDELLQWERSEFSPEALIQRLKLMFTTTFSFQSLTQQQIDTIRGAIYPEIVIREQQAIIQGVSPNFSLLPNDIVLITLDTKQENLAKSIGNGHRIFFGVAGSGKTLLLLARAKILINQNQQAKILILCFNVSLASYLKSLLYEDSKHSQYQKIEIFNFDQWAKIILGKLPAQVQGNRDEYIANLVLNKLISNPETYQWDGILIDEAHTFIPKWFECCVKALKNGENGDLMIVADGSQGIYKRDNFSWKQVGIKAQGRTISSKFDLDKNYRNTVEILNASWSLLSQIQQKHQQLETEEIIFPSIKPELALRHGAKPKLILADSLEKQQMLVIKTIQQLHQKGFEQKDIAILYRQKNGKQLDQIMTQLQELNISFYWVTENNISKANYTYNREGIRIITCLSSLGLEFKAVLIIWLEQFDDCVNNRPGSLMNTRQLYVAMTRCQENLFLFGLNNSKIVQELTKNEYFQVESC